MLARILLCVERIWSRERLGFGDSRAELVPRHHCRDRLISVLLAVMGGNQRGAPARGETDLLIDGSRICLKSGGMSILGCAEHAAVPETPLLNLAPRVLLAALTADYVHAQLCRAGLQAFAAENEARMAAMHTEIERKMDRLQGQTRIVRQEAITAETIEQAAGGLAGRTELVI